jgi:beta-mannosidase
MTSECRTYNYRKCPTTELVWTTQLSALLYFLLRMKATTALLTIDSAMSFMKADLSSTNQQWMLQNCEGNIQVPATVPGIVHTDLLAAGVLKQNPYYRFNELDQSWVSKETCWKYSTRITLDALNDKDPVFLRLSGVDTIADVTFNSQKIGSTSNAFKTYVFEIPRDLITNSNSLGLDISSPVSYSHEQASKYPYSVPHTINYNVWAEPSDRNFIRKAGSDFGWDWGPAYAPSGVTGDISIFQSQIGKLESLVMTQDLNADYSSVTFTPRVRVVGVASDATVSISVAINGDTYLQSDYTIHAGQDVISLGSFDLHKPTLWYPVGFGEPYLYDVEVSYCTKDRACQSLKKRIGVREVELVREAITESETPLPGSNTSVHSRALKASDAAALPSLGLYTVPNQNFYFRINGQPVFARGANFIPIDSFNSRVTHADREYTIKAALAANMNMIRVWGGGVYQPDDFYELADEMGMMVWEETMFACALYPINSEFIENAYDEIVDVVWSMSSHPSIVIWGGNNENEVALGWFSQSNSNRDLYVADYVKLYVDTIYRAIGDVEGHNQRAFVDSSPSNGVISSEPYVKQWGYASTAGAGDAHFYDYSSDCEAYSMYPQSKFISEFGFQVNPSYLAYEPVTTAEDRSADSEFIAYRQRHENGNTEMKTQMSRHFNLPAVCGTSDDSAPLGSFDSYLYLSQLQQGRCYETAINYWRSLRSSPSAQTMGILYWQLNDIWEVSLMTLIVPLEIMTFAIPDFYIFLLLSAMVRVQAGPVWNGVDDGNLCNTLSRERSLPWLLPSSASLPEIQLMCGL